MVQQGAGQHVQGAAGQGSMCQGAGQGAVVLCRSGGGRRAEPRGLQPARSPRRSRPCEAAGAAGVSCTYQGHTGEQEHEAGKNAGCWLGCSHGGWGGVLGGGGVCNSSGVGSCSSVRVFTMSKGAREKKHCGHTAFFQPALGLINPQQQSHGFVTQQSHPTRSRHILAAAITYVHAFPPPRSSPRTGNVPPLFAPTGGPLVPYAYPQQHTGQCTLPAQGESKAGAWAAGASGLTLGLALLPQPILPAYLHVRVEGGCEGRAVHA